MAEEGEHLSFNFSSMDWDAYVRFRPIYPKELYSMIYAYHDSHGGTYNSVIDVGAGIGVVSAELVKKFSCVTVTDPFEEYVSQAKAHFANLPEEKVRFVQAGAEDISLEKLPDGEKVDLITAAECLHWADLEVAVPKFASVLKPSGTVAAWLYGVRPILSEHSGNLGEARKIFYEIYDKMALQYDTQLEKQHETSGGGAMNARLESMAFSSETWTDVRRIYTNKNSPMAHERWPSSPSKVSAGESIETAANEELLYQHADYEYLEGYLVNWIPPIKVKEFAKSELARLKEIMNGQKIGVTWPFVLVLATKK